MLSERVGKIETKVGILEDELPLFAYDIEEIQEHAARHIKQLLGEKYKDNSLRAKTYINLYKKIEEEFNVYCYKGLARKKLADVHEFIDCYKGVEYMNSKNKLEKIMFVTILIRFIIFCRKKIKEVKR